MLAPPCHVSKCAEKFDPHLPADGSFIAADELPDLLPDLGGSLPVEIDPDARVYEDQLRAYPFLETHRKAFDIAADLLASYHRLGPGDAIIAATAIANDAELWTADRDFDDLVTDGLRLFA